MIVFKLQCLGASLLIYRSLDNLASGHVNMFKVLTNCL